jgi:carbon monoxide dehydrogenase subunit G
MEFTNTFHVPLPLEDAWRLMLDVPRILPCLPGARLTEVVGENTYKGSVSVRLGPIRLTFDGQAELVRKDDAQHIAWLEGGGIDPKGRGSARAEFSFALTPVDDGNTRVTVSTHLTLSGSVAQYGRGSGMIAEVATQILGQFERNLAQSLAGGAAAEDAAGDAAEDAAQPSLAPPGAWAAGAGSTAGAARASAAGTQVTGNVAGSAAGATLDSQAVLLQAQAVLSQAQAVLALAQTRLVQGRARPPQPASGAGELNMLSIGMKAMWARIRHGVASIFGRGA